MCGTAAKPCPAFCNKASSARSTWVWIRSIVDHIAIFTASSLDSTSQPRIAESCVFTPCKRSWATDKRLSWHQQPLEHLRDRAIALFRVYYRVRLLGSQTTSTSLMCMSAKLSKPCAVLSSHDLIPGAGPGIKFFSLIMRSAVKRSRNAMTCCLGLGYDIAQASK
jgi:hypothetical protein